MTSLRRASHLLVVLAAGGLATCVGGGCSSDTAEDASTRADTSSAPNDAAIRDASDARDVPSSDAHSDSGEHNVDSMGDTSTDPLRDDRADGEGRDGGDSTPEVYQYAMNLSDHNFYVLNSNYAVYVDVNIGSGGGETTHSYVILYELPQPGGYLRVADWKRLDETIATLTVVDETVVLAKQTDERRIEVALYEERSGKLERLSKPDRLAPWDRSHNPTLLDVVTNGTRTAVVLEDWIVELSVRPDATLPGASVAKSIDRNPENAYLDDLFYVPREMYIMTPSGHIVEVVQGVAVWTLDAGDGESALLGRKGFDNAIAAISNGDWTYRPSSNHVYVPSEKEAMVFDVSTSTSPGVAATWHVEEDFEQTRERIHQMSVSGNYLYWDEDRGAPQMREEAVAIVDLWTDPTAINSITYIDNFARFGLREPFSIVVARGDSLYLKCRPPRAVGEPDRFPEICVKRVTRDSFHPDK